MSFPSTIKNLSKQSSTNLYIFPFNFDQCTTSIVTLSLTNSFERIKLSGTEPIRKSISIYKIFCHATYFNIRFN